MNYYDALGVPRDAKLNDIGRAYNRLKSDFRKETTVPDPKREALLDEAYAVLSDEAKRDEYDAQLRVKPRKPVPKSTFIAGGAVALVAIAAGLYFAMRTDAPAQKPGKSHAEIQVDAARSVGRVQSLDMAGGSKAMGLAFAIEPGVMATSCRGLVPGAQLTVMIAPRSIPARIATTDEAQDLCKLAVDGGASWPLAVAGVEPRPGDQVYATSLNATGEVVLTVSKVKGVRADGAGRVIDLTVPVPGAGTPVLDIYGRVLAVSTATGPEGAVRLVPMPSSFVASARPKPAPAPMAASAPAELPAASAPSAPAGASDAEIDQAKYREEIGKALKGTGKERWGEKIRPPPQVPKDL